MKIVEKEYRWNGKLSKRQKTKRIVLHHAEATTCTADQIHSWHLDRGWCGIGYHFFVSKDGIIYRGRPEDTVGSHAKGANADSLGICAEGKYTTETMPEEQKQAIADLVIYLKEKYKISLVQKHKEVTDTNCPGKNYPFNEIMERVNKPVKPTTKEKYKMKTLKKGSTGNDVTIFESIMKKMGYYNGGIDTTFGSKCEEACNKFQKDYPECGTNGKPDETFGPKCWKKVLSLLEV